MDPEMADPPTVSILLPVFEAEATLSACLRSIERQTFTGWSCLVVDDGSGDESRQIAESFAARDARFEILPGPHRGLVPTLARGLERCTGDYVARMDADDLMHRNRLQVQVDHLERFPNLAAAGAHVRLFPRRDLGPGLRAYEAWLASVRNAATVRRDAFVECPIAHPTWLMRRSVLQSYGYRQTNWPEDYDLVLRLLADGHEFGVVPQRLLAWREHPLRLTHAGDVYRIERFTALKAEFLRRGLLARQSTYVLWGYGHTGRALRRALLAHDRRPSHIVEVHPGRLGQVIHGAPVITPEQLIELRGQPIIASVAGEKPRAEVRAALDRMGFVELRDFVCAA